MWVNLLIAVISLTCKIENVFTSGSEAENISLFPNAAPTEKVCSSEACESAAARIKAWMSEADDPCDDFFQFACGGWLNSSDARETHRFDLEEDVINKVKDLLESDVTTPDPRTNRLVTNMRKHYNNCVNFESVDNATDIIKQFLTEIPLPHIDSAGWENIKLESFFAELETLSLQFVLRGMIGIAMDNTTTQILLIDQPSFENEYNLLNDFPEKYLLTRKSVITQVLKQVYEDLNIDNVTFDADAILNLEILLANATIKRQPRHCCPTDNQWTVSQLQSKIPNFDWRKYLDQLLAHQNPPRTLPDDFILTMAEPDYFQNLEGILENEGMELTFGLLATFLLVEKFKDDLPKNYREIFQILEKVRYGNVYELPRWKYCTKKVVDGHRFVYVASRIYSQVYFDHAAKTAPSEIVSRIKRAFFERLEKNVWINKSGREFVARKTQLMTEDVGYADHIYDTNYMEREYGWMNVSDRGYLLDDIQIIKGMHSRGIALLWYVNVNKELIISPLVVNAYYLVLFNKLNIPMGFLVPPYYHKEYPNYLNYGGVGYTIGHELSHAFTGSGLTKDEHGNSKAWISKDDKEFKASYEEALQCLIDQYNEIRAPFDGNLTVDGELTLNENVGDNVGVTLAFEAYRRWVKNNGERELQLPGLDYTPEQLLFINMGQAYCGKVTRWGWINMVTHPPGIVRVNGALSNSPNFQETFQCRPEDKMNSVTKCSVW